nr:MAG TPA: hypothetical protein [Bacteriophage sp.]
MVKYSFAIINITLLKITCIEGIYSFFLNRSTF